MCHCNVLMTSEMHNSYNQFYSTVFYLVYMFQKNLDVHRQEHGIIYYITQYNRAGESSTIVLCNTVYYAVLLMMNLQIPSKHAEQTKKLWNTNLL
jgi:hypothetical protein